MSKKPNKTLDISHLQDLMSMFKKTIGDLYKKETSSLHCSLSHLEVMHYISEHGSSGMKDIAKHLGITPPSVTTIIDSMVANGLVKRDASAGDRRSVKVVLTGKATKLHGTLRKKKTHMLTLLLKKLSDEQKEQLSDIISTLVK